MHPLLLLTGAAAGAVVLAKAAAAPLPPPPPAATAIATKHARRLMRHGVHPEEAAARASDAVADSYDKFVGVNRRGRDLDPNRF